MSDIDLSEALSATPQPPRRFWGRDCIEPVYEPLSETMITDVLVIGGGITGALIADHLSSRGLSVIVVDQDRPATGSTAASTAMLQWELDVSLTDLTHRYGFERAAGIYRRSAAAVAGLGKLIDGKGLQCDFKPRKTLYLTSNHEGARDLLEEAKLRRRAGLPATYLEHCDLFTQFEIDRDAAILSPGSAQADPLLLSWGLISHASGHGARLVSGHVRQLNSEGGRVTAELDGPHVIDAGHVVLATGCTLPGIAMPKLHRAASSFVLATVTQVPGTLWREECLIWEDSHPYLYMRPTSDGRIIAGGEDETIVEPELRNAKLAAKADAIREKMTRLWPKADTEISASWCGTYSDTTDGVPLIGHVPDMPNVYAATGYGGNGMTFSYLASLMIGAMISGVEREWFADFALDRDRHSPLGDEASEPGRKTHSEEFRVS